MGGKKIALGRVVDAVVLLLLVLLIYRILVAPRVMRDADAHPAPRVTYAMLSGKPFVLTQHRGRVVFLDFWASWCRPCKVALPMVERYAREHPEVDVVPVDVGEPRDLVAQFARNHHLGSVALDPQTLSTGFFAIEGFPTMVVVDPQGRVRATWPGFNPAIELIMGRAERTLTQRSS